MRTYPRMACRHPFVLAGTVAALLSAPALTPLRASNSWDGGDASSNTWSTATNWDDNFVPTFPAALTFGAFATNNVVTNNDLTGITLNGLTFDANAAAFTLSGNAVTLGGNITNNSSKLQTISLGFSTSAGRTIAGGTGGLLLSGPLVNTATGVITIGFTGTGTILNNLTAPSGGSTIIGISGTNTNWTLAGNNTATLEKGSFNITGGTFNFGNQTDSPNLTIAAGSGTDNTMTNGTFNMVSGVLVMPVRLNTANAANAVSIVNQTGGILRVWNQIQMSNNGVTNTSTFNLSAGVLDIRNTAGTTEGGGNLFVASRGVGTVNISGSALVECTVLDVSRSILDGTKGTVNLDGGTLLASTITTVSANGVANHPNSTANFNFNGGTLKARASSATFIRENSQNLAGSPPLIVTVKAGGAIIDSNGFNVGTNIAMLHDGTLGATADGGLTKLGNGTLTMGGSNTFTGQTTVNGGTLTLDYTVNDNSKLSDTAPLVLGGGTLNLNAGTHVEAVASTTLNPGASGVSSTAAGAVLQLRSITRNLGSTLNFGADNIANTNTSNDASGILGGWATVNNSDWATSSAAASDTPVTTYAGYQGNPDPAGWTALDNVNLLGDPFSGISTGTINSLKLSGTSNVTINPGATLILASGGVLSTGSGISAINGGSLKGAAGADLIVHQHNTTNPLSIASDIVDNGGPTGLTKSGNGSLVLMGTNTYTGGTTLNAGTLQMGNANALGNASGALSVNAGTLDLNGNNLTAGAFAGAGGTITSTFAGAITLTAGDSTNTRFNGILQDGSAVLGFTKLGNGTLTLTGANTYSGPTIISSGTLRLGNGSTLGSINAASPVTVNGILAIQHSDDVTFSNAVNGTGALQQNGSGTLTVSGNNTYSGGTTINAGILKVGSTAALGDPSGALVINGGSLDLNGNSISVGDLSGNGAISSRIVGPVTLTAGASANTTFTGVIRDGSGVVSVSKQGSGTLTLTGTHNYTGSTSVTNGSLVIGGSLTSTSAISVASGATLNVTTPASINLAAPITLDGTLVSNANVGTLTTNATSLVIPGASATDGSAGTLTIGALNANGGNYRLDVGSDLLSVTGLAHFIGAGSLSLTPTAGVALGTYTILQAGTLTIDPGFTFNVIQPPIGRTHFDINLTTANTIKLDVTGTVANLVWKGNLDAGGGTFLWDAGTTKNWLSSGLADFFFNGDSVTFDNTGTNKTVTLNTNVAPTSVTVNNSGAGNDYTITGTGGIVGVSGLTKLGTGTLTLGGSQNYSGTTAVRNGTLRVASNTSLSSNSPIVLGNGTTSGILDLNGNSVAVSGLTTSGTGTANIIGNSSTTSDATLTISGGTNTFNGIIQDTIGAGARKVALTVAGGTTTLTGTNTFTGTASLNGGTLIFANLAGLGGGTDLQFGGGTLLYGPGVTTDISSKTLTFNAGGGVIDTNGNDVTFANSIGNNGPGAFTKAGTGTLTLNGTATHTGGTTVTGGTLRIGANDLFADASAVTADGGTLDLGTSSDTVGAVTLKNNGTISGSTGVLTASSYVVESGSVTATLAGGTLTKNNTGTVTLSGANTYTGNTVVNNGTLNIEGSAINTPAAQILVNQGTINFGSLASAPTLTINNSPAAITGEYITIGNVANGTGTFNMINGTLNIFDGGTTNRRFALANVATGGSQGFWNQTGGTATISGTGFASGSSPGVFGGNQTGSVTAFNISGGTFDIGAGVNAIPFHVTTRGAGQLNISQTGIVKITGALNLNRANGGATASGTVNLDGGTLQVGSVTRGGTVAANGTATFNFNGGIFKPSASNAGFWTENTNITANIKSGGAIVDTAGFDITIGQPLLDGGGGGGLTKNGNGTLSLGGTNTYTGPTLINGGTLQIGSGGTTGSLGTAPSVTNNGTLSFNRSDNVTFGTVVNGTGSLQQSGTGTLTVTGANTYSGQTIVQNGTLQIGALGSIPGGTALVFGNASTNTGGTLDLHGFDLPVSNINSLGTGTSTIGNSSTTLSSTLSFSTGTGLFSGNIVNSIGAGSQPTALNLLSGNLTLSGNNTYTGSTTIAGGATLQLGSGGATGSLGATTVTNNGTLILNRSDNTGVLSNAITGSGTLIKNGSGTVTLSGTNTYTGLTTINEGALSVTGSLLSAGNVQINTSATAAGTLMGTGSAGNVTLAADNGSNVATLRPGPGGNLTLASLAVNGGNLQYLLGSSPSVNDRILVTNLANFASASTVTATFNAAPVTGNSYTLLTAGTRSGVLPTLQAPTDSRFTFGLSTATANTLKLVVSGTNKTLDWSGIVNGTWDIKGTPNWLSGANSETFFQFDAVNFGDAFGTRTVVLDTEVIPASVTVNNSTGNDYTIGGTGRIAGATTNLTKSGNGVLVLTGENTYGGATIINGGLLQIGDGGAIGRVGTGPITNNASLLLNRADDTLVLANNILGTGSIIQTGTGTVTLTGTGSTYSGNTEINVGTLKIGNSSALGNATGNTTIASGATLDLSGSTSANSLNFGAEQIFALGAGVGGNGAIVNSGVSQMNALQHLTLLGDTAIGGSGRFDIRGSGSTLKLNDQGGTLFTLTKKGTGQFSIANTTVSDGNIAIESGTFSIESGSLLQGVDVTNGTITYSQGTTAAFLNTLSGNLTRPMTFNGITVTNQSSGNSAFVDSNILMNGADQFDIGTGSLALTGSITGTGSLTKIGNGTLELNGSATYSGATLVNAGTLLVKGTLSGTLSVDVQAGGTLGGNGNITTTGNVTLKTGSSLAPGASVGVLNVTAANVSLAEPAGGAGYLKFELGNPSLAASDSVSLTATTVLTIGFNGLDLDDFAFVNAGGFGEGTYVLFDTATDIVGTLGTHLSGPVLGLDAQLMFANGVNGRDDIVLVVAPEPATWSALLASALLLGVRRRRR